MLDAESMYIGTRTEQRRDSSGAVGLVVTASGNSTPYFCFLFSFFSNLSTT